METDSYRKGLNSIFSIIQIHAPGTGEVVGIIATLILVLISALISGSEVAYFSIKPADIERLKKENTKKSSALLSHLKESDKLLATILVANNFVNVSIVILASFVTQNIVDFGTSTTLKFIFEAVFITALILFFGEILPKVFASRHPVKFALWMAFPLIAIKKITHPISFLLLKSSSAVNKRLARKSKGLSMDDLSHALELTSNDLSDDKDILEGIVTFGNKYVSEIMTPRIDVIDIDIKSTFNKVNAVIIESGYSRIPIYEDTPDHVKGILYVKDLLPHLNSSDSFDWKQVIRQAYYVPETKKINDLLADFQSRKIHVAVVVDEYGGTAGIVTLEDVLEEIVGEINDETDDEEKNYITLPDGSLVFEGKTLLNDFHKITDTEEKIFEDIRGDAETLAGLLLEIKGEIPDKNELIEYKNYQFTIVSADARRIKKVKFKLIPIINPDEKKTKQ